MVSYFHGTKNRIVGYVDCSLDRFSQRVNPEGLSGAVAVSGSDAFVCDKMSSMEIVRNDFSMETEMDSGVTSGTYSSQGNAATLNPLNSLRNIGTELR